MKTSELIGAALDWAVAESNETPIYRSGKTLTRMDMDGQHYWQPSTDWAQAGPIIERKWITLECWPNESDENMRWAGTIYDTRPVCEALGPTPLIAAMRCYVASVLGDEVNIPPDLT